MPEEEKVKPSEKLVDIDTSGPEKDVAVEEVKEEAIIETKEEEPKITEVVKEEPVKEEDAKLEDYSKGVQGRIAKLTRKMREAERREAAATEYANSLEQARRVDQDRFQKVDSDYTKKFEDNIKTGMDSAQNELARAIEAGPLFVEAPMAYPELLRETGWRVIEVQDLSAASIALCRQFIAEDNERGEELIELLGQSDFDDRQSLWHARLSGLREGLLRRQLFVATPVG